MRFAAPKTTFLGFYPVFFAYDFVVCRLERNSSKYPTLPGFLMSSVYVDLAFQHSTCSSFTFDVVMHRSTFSTASACVCVCTACVKNIYTCSSCWQLQERFSELFTLRQRCTTHCSCCCCAHCIARSSFHCVSCIELYRVFVVLFVCLLLAEADKETQCEVREDSVHVSLHVGLKYLLLTESRLIPLSDLPHLWVVYFHCLLLDCAFNLISFGFMYFF